MSTVNNKQVSRTKLLLGASLCAIAFSAMATTATAQDSDEAEDATRELDTVVVKGIRGSLNDAIELKRNSDQIVDTITSEDIGKFPDQNIAESLQRVAGVQIQRGIDSTAGSSSGDGEGSTVSIRGLRPDLVKVTINGNSMSSTTGGRDFNFSNLPPELVDRLEVYKSPIASQDEGAIGGTVNLKTRTPLGVGKFLAVGSGKLTYHELADETNYQVTGLFNQVFGTNENFGILVGGNYSDQSLRRDSIESFGWNTPPNGFQGLIARDIRPNLKLEDREKVSLNASVEWQMNDNFNFRVDGLYTNQVQDETASNYQLRVGNNGTVNATTANANGTAVFVDTSPRNNNQRFHRVVAFERTDTRETSNIVANLDWQGDMWNVNTRVGYTEGSYERDPSLFAVFAANADLTYSIGPDSIWPVLTSSATDVLNPDPSVFRLITASRALNTNKDTEEFGQIDFTRDLSGDFFTTVQFGIKHRDRKQVFTKAVDAASGGERSGFTLADFVTDFPVDDFASDLSGSPLPLSWPFPDTSAILDVFSTDAGGLLGDPIVRTQDTTSNFDVREETLAGYVQANFEKDKIRGNIGVRVVKTMQENNGFQLISGVPVEISSSREYTNTLPSMNVTYAVQDDLLLRFAAAQVMTRPTFKELSNAGTINAGANTANLGNPLLDPYGADTFDLALEWYFEEGGLLSAGLFFKDVNSFVTKSQATEVLPGQGPNPFIVNRPINGSAELKGIELSYQQNMTFLPEPFNNFGVVTNYTYVDSESSFTDNNGGALPFPGTSKHSANLIGFYEAEKFSARLAYNTRSKFVLFPLSLGGQAVSRKAYDQLDATVSYDVSDRLSFVFEATNLTGSTVYDYAGVEERWVAWRDTGRRFSFNTRLKF